jgi:mRNA interferase RelE/StbE
MPKYTAVLTKKAQKQLDKLSDNIAEPILEAIAGLEENPRPQGYIKLKGRDGYRIRVGNYRIIYDIFDTELIIDIISHSDIEKIFMSKQKSRRNLVFLSTLLLLSFTLLINNLTHLICQGQHFVFFLNKSIRKLLLML